MKRWPLAVGLLIATAALLAAKPGASETEPAGDDTKPRLYGVTWQGELVLIRVNRGTLRPVPGLRVRLAGEPLAWSFSPDRSRLVIGSAARGARLRLIDLRAGRALGDIAVSRRGSEEATAWAGPRRLLAVVVTPGCCGAGDTVVAGVDTGRRRVIWRHRLGGSLQAGERFGGGLLLVLGPRGRSVGPSRLVQVGPRGAIRSAALPDIRSGIQADGRVTQNWNPGMAVDRSGSRAFVVQAQAPVAEVDLQTFGVRSHPLPLRAADAVTSPTRHALWLGRGLLAVTGSDRRQSTAGLARETPAGLTLVDTLRWRSRLIDARASEAALVSGTLLASSFLFDSRGPKTPGSGLTGYSIDGRRKFHLYGRDPIGVQPLGRRALAGGLGQTSLIDARTGRQLRRFRRFTMSLLARDAPFFY